MAQIYICIFAIIVPIYTVTKTQLNIIYLIFCNFCIFVSIKKNDMATKECMADCLRIDHRWLTRKLNGIIFAKQNRKQHHYPQNKTQDYGSL